MSTVNVLYLILDTAFVVLILLGLSLHAKRRRAR